VQRVKLEWKYEGDGKIKDGKKIERLETQGETIEK